MLPMVIANLLLVSSCKTYQHCVIKITRSSNLLWYLDVMTIDFFQDIFVAKCPLRRVYCLPGYVYL